MYIQDLLNAAKEKLKAMSIEEIKAKFLEHGYTLQINQESKHDSSTKPT